MSEKKENTVMGMETTAVPVESANTTIMQKEAAAAGQPHPKIEVELSPHDDFVLDIAVGKNRNQKNWKPYKITFKQLKERLAKTVYTDETMAQYATFSRTKQGEIKDVGGMVMAVLKGGHRGKQDVLSRSAITLDIDYGVPGIEDVLDFTTDFAGIIYSTHKHKPEAPRLRLVIPLSRSVMAEEYVAIARKVAEEIDIEMFDDTTYEPNRLMYWPSTSKDGVYVYRELHGDLLNPDSVLARYKNWHDVSEYPVSSRQTKIVQHMMQKQKDPLTKNNLIGAFCQAYDIPSAIGSFLNEVYEPTASPDRYSYIPADSVAGVVVYENKFMYSHHATDPASGMLLNSFDAVRVHRFGNLDGESVTVTETTKLPSYKAMCEFAAADGEVKKVLLQMREAAAEADFKLMGGKPPKSGNSGNASNTAGATVSANNVGGTPADPDAWKTALDYSKSGQLVNSIRNLLLILSNDPELKGIRYNALADNIEFTGKAPWGRPEKEFWRDQDDAQLMAYLEAHYGTFSDRNFKAGLTKIADDRSYHPIKQWLDALPKWDGTERLDTLLYITLGAEDTPYIRAVTRKTFVAAIARVKHPGIKFDSMLVMKGEQGCGKSTLIRRMGGNWYNDSLQLNDTKDKTAAEKLQGYWIMEIGELAGLRKADTEILKGFLSRQDDIFRAAFGRRATPHPRQCVFIGTTNAENGYLRDVTGNRRFWPVNTPGFKEEDRVRGCRPSWELSDEEVKQIWAEALYRYEQGEKLYLEGDIGIEAIHQQKMSMETDDREPMVREYLDKLLPANWDSLTLFQRRDYIQGTEFSNDGVSTLPGTVKRTVVCNQEIWCECFGRDRGSIGRQDSNSIIAMMERIEGWKRSPKKQRVKGYGIVNVYVRDAGDEE